MIRVLDAGLHRLELHTRIPFRYGIATLTQAPHLILRLELEVNGRQSAGLAADNLVPKWFSKDPAQSYEDELAAMLDVIRQAVHIALEAGPWPTVFQAWQHVYAAQRAWAQQTPHPPLLWQFGVSLVERALIDAFCRAENITFAEAVRGNPLGIDLGRIHSELAGLQPALLLPASPTPALFVRHTVGMLDPLAEADIPEHQRLDDGLPQSLEAAIQRYGLRYFKVKLSGKAETDVERLQAVVHLLERLVPDYACTLDGNEQFDDVDALRNFWEQLRGVPALSSLLDNLLFVEQPLRRDVALSDATASRLLAWPERPPLIIDESDAELHSLPRALAAGYAGTSHKNCKGVFKGIANACLLAYRRQQRPEQPAILSGEDLTNVGPIALHQDLAVMATLGLEHVERNGHFYIGGLEHFPSAWQQLCLRHHPDLYVQRARDAPALLIRNGHLSLNSILKQPFGTAPALDCTDCPTLSLDSPVVLPL
ncbi:MAG: hypothetical protein D6775_04155 [Caldilineae bacterium]|nr:MAG: hypothetical protein D6775_04155 [Caldilineae bacterium]